jgi:hypothetical protein
VNKHASLFKPTITGQDKILMALTSGRSWPLQGILDEGIRRCRRSALLQIHGRLGRPVGSRQGSGQGPMLYIFFVRNLLASVC